jgi:hypothetical protein
MEMSPSRSSKRFNLEATLKALERIARQHSSRSKKNAALEHAAMALHFVYAQGLMADFLEYVKLRDSDPITIIPPERCFKSKGAAMKWLRAHPAPSQGIRVEAAGVTYVVARQRTDKWLLVPTLSSEELMEVHRKA